MHYRHSKFSSSHFEQFSILHSHGFESLHDILQDSSHGSHFTLSFSEKYKVLQEQVL